MLILASHLQSSQTRNMNSRRKIRAEQHLMESDSYRILHSILPKHWVIREFNHPDYGVDLVIEIFEPYDLDQKQYEAMGEFLYIQVKSVQVADVQKIKLFDVQNVAKGQWTETRETFIEADVIKYALDTISLFTVQQMGSSISFLLFLVDLKSENAYFICLNDLIDKYIIPKNKNYLSQKTVTLNIPVKNDLRENLVANSALKIYAKRAKLLAAFAKFFYQRNEILYFFDIRDMPISTFRNALDLDGNPQFDEYITMINVFISQIEHLDIWLMKGWEAISISHNELNSLISLLKSHPNEKIQIIEQTFVTWHSLCNLSNVYEELVREWFLPKKLSYFLSYPDLPTEYVKQN